MARKKFLLIAKNKTTMEIFKTLLATNKVANNFFGFSSNCVIILDFLGFFSLEVFKSSAESEKKATSAPEIKAAKKSNSSMITIPRIELKSK